MKKKVSRPVSMTSKQFSEMVASARKLAAETHEKKPKVKEDYPGQILHETLNMRHT